MSIERGLIISLMTQKSSRFRDGQTG